MAMRDQSLELLLPRSRSPAMDYWTDYMIEGRPTQSVDRVTEAIQPIPRIGELNPVQMARETTNEFMGLEELRELKEREFSVWHKELKDRELSTWCIPKEMGLEYPPLTEHQPPRIFNRKESEHIDQVTERIARAVGYITQNLVEKESIEDSSEIRKRVWEALGKE